MFYFIHLEKKTQKLKVWVIDTHNNNIWHVWMKWWISIFSLSTPWWWVYLEAKMKRINFSYGFAGRASLFIDERLFFPPTSKPNSYCVSERDWRGTARSDRQMLPPPKPPPTQQQPPFPHLKHILADGVHLRATGRSQHPYRLRL